MTSDRMQLNEFRNIPSFANSVVPLQRGLFADILSIVKKCSFMAMCSSVYRVDIFLELSVS